MGSTVLVEKELRRGQHLIHALDAAGHEVLTAFWYIDPESERWKFVLAMDLRDREGPLAAYRAVNAVIESLPEDQRVEYGDLRIISPGSGMARDLRRIFHSYPISEDGFRLTGHVLDRVLIDDAIIYRAA